MMSGDNKWRVEVWVKTKSHPEWNWSYMSPYKFFTAQSARDYYKEAFAGQSWVGATDMEIRVSKFGEPEAPETQWYYGVMIKPDKTFSIFGEIGTDINDAFKKWKDKGYEYIMETTTELEAFNRAVKYNKDREKRIPIPAPKPVPVPEKKEVGTVEEQLISFPQTIYTSTNPPPKELTETIPEEWGKKIVDFILPINAVNKLLFHKSIYKGESGEMTSFDWVDIGVSVLILAGGVGLFGKLAEKVGAETAEKAVARGVVENVIKETPEASKVLKAGLSSEKIGYDVAQEMVKKPSLFQKAIAELPFADRLGLVKGVTKTIDRKAPKEISGWIKALVIWNVLTDPVWIQSMAREFYAELTGNVTKRMNVLRFTINEQVKELNNKVNFANSKQDWEAVKIRLEKLKPLLLEYERLLKEGDAEEKIPEVWNEYQLLLSNFREFEVKAGVRIPEGGPLLVTKEVLESKFTKEFNISNFSIDDGDTITWYSHPMVGYKMVFEDERIPEVMTTNRIRFLGIDTHEKETVAGKAETDYLKSLIEGKTITIKINEYFDPEKVIGRYGRLLAGIFLDGEDIVKKMLAKFGTDILTKKTYRKKYRWIDWDEYERVAKAKTEKVPTEEFKISIDSEPTRAKLYIDGYYTHHLTPSGGWELKDCLDLLTPGRHTIKLVKGSLYAEKEVDIVEGKNEPIFLTLIPTTVPIPIEPVPEIPPTVSENVATEILTDVWNLTKGREIMSEDEFMKLMDKYGITIPLT